MSCTVPPVKLDGNLQEVLDDIAEGCYDLDAYLDLHPEGARNIALAIHDPEGCDPKAIHALAERLTRLPTGDEASESLPYSEYLNTDQFDMSGWGSPVSGDRERERIEPWHLGDVLEPGDTCGTTACAAGWVLLDSHDYQLRYLKGTDVNLSYPSAASWFWHTKGGLYVADPGDEAAVILGIRRSRVAARIWLLLEEDNARAIFRELDQLHTYLDLSPAAS